ncbi:hypothetical protein ACIRYZ_14170 [Kitasatospora sp. NPDC101155]
MVNLHLPGNPEAMHDPSLRYLSGILAKDMPALRKSLIYISPEHS